MQWNFVTSPLGWQITSINRQIKLNKIFVTIAPQWVSILECIFYNLPTHCSATVFKVFPKA